MFDKQTQEKMRQRIEKYSENLIFEKVQERTIEELKRWIARTCTYQFDFNKITFSNLDESQNKKIELFNFYNGMSTKLLRMSRMKSESGTSCIAIRVGKGKVLVDVLEIVSTPKYINNDLVEIYTTHNTILQINEIKHITFYRFIKKNKQIYVEYYLEPYDEGRVFDEISLKNSSPKYTFYYQGIDYIPVQIFSANEEGIADWEYVKNTINLVGYFNQQMALEWPYIRTVLINNMSLAPTKDADELQKEIESNNKRIHDAYDDGGQLQQALSYLSNGGVTMDIAKSIIEHLKSEIRERLFMISRTAGGNNKHTTEALNDNIEAYGYIWTKKTLLREEISKLYFMIIDINNKYRFTKFFKLPDFLESEIQFARPIELLLNLNAEGQEKDNMVQEIKKTGDSK